jgi:hypothetical protein
MFEIENQDCENFVRSFKNLRDFRIAFRNTFKYIVAFHATNLSNYELEEIKKDGLKIATKELLEKKALHRFIVKDSKNDCKEIEKSIKEWFSTDNPFENKFYTKNEINFFMLKEDLFEHYHYLLFGAESLLPIATYLSKKHSKLFRKILVDSGSHYIFEVLVPVVETKGVWIDTIYNYFNFGHSDACLVIYNNLAIENFVKIEKVDKPIDKQNLIFR